MISECTSGAIPCRVFFCTDPTLTVVQILEGYGRRWAIEVCFRELKQLLGFADSSARKEESSYGLPQAGRFVYAGLELRI